MLFLAHLVGQAVCDIIDERHKTILPPEIWATVIRTACENGGRSHDGHRSCDAKVHRCAPKLVSHPAVVNGSPARASGTASTPSRPRIKNTGKKVLNDFAKRWLPILDVFENENVNFALEVHPTEIAFDIASAQRAIEAVKGHKRFGFNYDPSHLAYQGVDYVKFIRTFKDRIFHVHMKDVWWGHGDGTVGVFGGHTTFADPRRYWDFRSLGHGDVKFEEIIVALNDIGYTGR